MTNIPRLHGRITLAAVASLVGIVVVAIASNREWIPRTLGAVLVVAWIPIMVLLVVGSRILGNLRLASQPALRADTTYKRGLIGSIIGVVLGLVLVVLAYILTH